MLSGIERFIMTKMKPITVTRKKRKIKKEKISMMNMIMKMNTTMKTTMKTTKRIAMIYPIMTAMLKRKI